MVCAHAACAACPGPGSYCYCACTFSCLEGSSACLAPPLELFLPLRPHHLTQYFCLSPCCPIQIVILGTGKKALESQVKNLEKQFPGLAAGVVKFSNPMAHTITAGALSGVRGRGREGLRAEKALRFGGWQDAAPRQAGHVAAVVTQAHSISTTLMGWSCLPTPLPLQPLPSGADFMVVPSRFEPCGLIQLHAMQVRPCSGGVPLGAVTCVLARQLGPGG